MTAARFVDIPLSDFPFVIEIFRVGLPDAEELLYRVEVTGPGAVDIPGFGAGGPVMVRMSYPDGRVEEIWPHELPEHQN